MKLTKLVFVSTSLLSLFLVGCTDEPSYKSHSKTPITSKIVQSTSQENNNQQETTRLIEPVGAWPIDIIDEGNHIYDKEQIQGRYYYPGLSVTLHAHPIENADLAMYANGKYQCIQTEVTIENETVWEYVFNVADVGVNTLEFKVVNRA